MQVRSWLMDIPKQASLPVDLLIIKSEAHRRHTHASLQGRAQQGVCLLPAAGAVLVAGLPKAAQL